MQCRITDLRCREVVNICDGLRLGYVSDVLLNAATGQILALIVPGKSRLFGLLGREDDYVIPWECIRRFGEDIVLIEVGGEYRREKPPRRSWF